MPSVVSMWAGTCPCREKQETLSRYIKYLAEINHEYWKKYPAPIAEINRAMHRAAGIAPLTGPTWREFDVPVDGRIVVSGDIIRRGFGGGREDRAAVAARMRESGLPIFMPQAPHAACHTSLESCRLRGVDLTVFDPRRLYPGNDRLSFVFLSETGSPLLDNRLVEVQEHGIFATDRANDRANDPVDCYLEAPTLHLRYMHEAFIDCLMAWVKWQFVDDLSYWRSEEWPDAALYEGWFAAAEERNRNEAHDIVFAKLCEEFAVECDAWIADAERNFQNSRRP